MNLDRQKEKMLLYLYGEMSPGQERAFEEEMKKDSLLRDMLEEEIKLNRAVPRGNISQVPDHLLQESRLRLRAALQGESEKGEPLLSRAIHFFGVLPSHLVTAGGAVALLLAGIFLGRSLLAPGEQQAKPPIPILPPASLVSLIKPEDLELTDLRIASFDPATRKVKLAFDAVSYVEVEGGLEDEAIQSVLATALQGDLESAARLETVALLQHHAATAQISEALIHALLHDENPGVRLEAIEALKELAVNEQVRKALQTALLRDANPGVRVVAIGALKNFQDPGTIKVLEQKVKSDANRFIRLEAERAIRKWRGASSQTH